MPLERGCLLVVKSLEVPVSGVLFKPAQRLRGGIHRLLAVPLGFFQISEVFALDPLIFRVVFRHGFSPLAEVTVYDGWISLTYSSLRLRKTDVQIPLNPSQLSPAG